MADRILNLRELNRATLARQMLLERETLSAPAAIERLVGLQAQLASAPYAGLWTRLRDFRREDLAGEIENRKVVKATMMRATLHLCTADDYARFRTALKPLLTGAAAHLSGRQSAGVSVPLSGGVRPRFGNGRANVVGDEVEGDVRKAASRIANLSRRGA